MQVYRIKVPDCYQIANCSTGEKEVRTFKTRDEAIKEAKRARDRRGQPELIF